MQKYTAEESVLLDAIEAGEFKSVDNLKEELAKAKQAAKNTVIKNKAGGVMMKYIIGLLLLFSTSLFTSDQNASRPIKKPNSYLYQMTHLIDQYYIDKNDSNIISSQINEKIINWYTTHCEHNKNDTINDLYVKWESIEQSCSDMNRSSQNLVANSILKEYDTTILDMTPYFSNQQYGWTGLILRNINSKTVVTGTVEQTSARTSKIPYGTIITSINGKSTSNLCLEDVVEMLKGPVGSTATVTTDGNISYTLVREVSSAPNVSHITIGNDIAIIKIRSFGTHVSADISKILEQLPPDINIVLDIRNNQGGLVDSVSDTLSLFVPPNTKLFSYISRNKNDNMDYISEDDLPKAMRKLINQNPNMAKLLTNTYKKKKLYKIKSITVLINQHTSAGAILAAKILQKENAILVGSSQETISSIKVVMPIDKIYSFKMPVAKFYFSDGTIASGTTVKSDIPFNTDSLDDEELYKKITTIIKNR